MAMVLGRRKAFVTRRLGLTRAFLACKGVDDAKAGQHRMIARQGRQPVVGFP
jgi:hypothetical protein